MIKFMDILKEIKIYPNTPYIELKSGTDNADEDYPTTVAILDYEIQGKNHQIYFALYNNYYGADVNDECLGCAEEIKKILDFSKIEYTMKKEGDDRWGWGTFFRIPEKFVHIIK